VAAELPSGTVTFLFTDIEASTRLLHELGDAQYRDVVKRHRVVLRAAFDAHDGREISTEGDSFFVAFDGAAGAVSAAVQGQLALAAGGDGVRVRMGVHTGQALLTDGDYYGLSVHQAARIAAAAHGGQVLMSAATAELCEGGLPVGAGLEDLGEYRLKDLERPQRLLQLCHPGLDSGFPAPRSLELVRHNLPVQTSSFVGRDQELAEVAKLLAAARLVSLLGPGGTGKTRLAYQVAAGAVGDFPGGIWVVELASVLDEGAVPLAALMSMGLREEPSREPTDTVVGYLRDRQALVILDNCEQVITAAAELAQTLLSRCPVLRVLVTSREGLHLPGEVVYQVPGLSLPSADLPDYLEALAGVDAVRLFVTRAADARSGFALTAGNAADIAAICARLDGLPLGIELAASRARSLSPAQINVRLGTALDLLSKGARGAQARQATLRGAIDWSHRLLDNDEQVLFRRLAVFVGGWQLEAAEQVCAGAGLELGDVFDTLDSLVDKSLVAVTEDERGQTRYRLLETIGAYAAERLLEAGEADTVAGRHSNWCASLALAASEFPQGSLAEAGWFNRLEVDHPNLLVALGHLRRRGDPEALEVATRLRRFWLNRGHERIGHDQFHAALAAAPGPSTARASVLGALGQVALNRGDYPEARARFEEALALARDLGDRSSEGNWVGGLGDIASSLGDYPEARARYQEALAIARDLGDRSSEGRWVGSLGDVARNLGDYPEARARIEEALAIGRDLGHRRSEGKWIGSLGNLASYVGDYPEARARYQEALAIARDLGDRYSEGNLVGNLGTNAASLGDYPEARARTEEALAIARDLGDRSSEGTWIGNLGNIAWHRGDCPEARARYQEALAIARDLGDRRDEGIWVGGLGNIAISLGDYPEARARYQEALVIARDLGDRRDEATWIGNLGGIASYVGDYPEARARYQEALALARDLGDRSSEGIWVGSLGDVAGVLGEYPEARARFEESLAIARDLGDRRSEGTWVGGLGNIAASLGDYPEARARYQDALAIARELQNPDLSVSTIDAVAVLLGRVGRHDEAVGLVAWADEAHRRSGAVRPKAEQESAAETIAAARDSIGDEALGHASNLGAARSAAETFDVAADSLAAIAEQ